MPGSSCLGKEVTLFMIKIKNLDERLGDHNFMDFYASSISKIM